jgi:hypothetical protein
VHQDDVLAPCLVLFSSLTETKRPAAATLDAWSSKAVPLRTWGHCYTPRSRISSDLVEVGRPDAPNRGRDGALAAFLAGHIVVDVDDADRGVGTRDNHLVVLRRKVEREDTAAQAGDRADEAVVGVAVKDLGFVRAAAAGRDERDTVAALEELGSVQEARLRADGALVPRHDGQPLARAKVPDLQNRLVPCDGVEI